jgi:adenine-specific DNA-methyltransferase
MYPRLKLAQKLLRDDGVIFISIDDNEQANLKLLMDDVFGERNFIASLIWRKKKTYGAGDRHFIPQTEYILSYSRVFSQAEEFGGKDERIEQRYKFKDEIGKYELLPLWHPSPKGTYSRPNLQYKLILDGKEIDSVTGQFLRQKERVEREYEEGLVVLKEFNGKYRVYKKAYWEHDASGKPRITTPTSYYDDATTIDSAKEINDIFQEKLFDFAKPTKLLKFLINIIPADDANFIILDFFAGSGTTAHAVMQLNAEDGGNRKFILVQLDEKIKSDSEAHKAGYKTIDEISRERIRRAATKIREENATTLPQDADLGFRHYRLKDISQTLDNIETFDPTQKELVAAPEVLAALANPETNTTGTDSLLATWLIDDGFTFAAKVERKTFSSYSAFYVSEGETNRLYLFDERWGTDAEKALLNSIGENKLRLSSIVIYSHSFGFEDLRQLKTNLKTVLDEQKIKLIERF